MKKRIKKAAIEVGNDPWRKGTIRVEGYENVRRKRIGRYRLLYAVDKHRKEILVVKIEHTKVKLHINCSESYPHSHFHQLSFKIQRSNIKTAT